MSEWYVRSDHDHVKLSRILDIAQDLKVSLIISVTIIILFILLPLNYFYLGIVSVVKCSAICICH